MRTLRVLLSAICCGTMLTSVCYADNDTVTQGTEQNYAVTTTAPEQTTTAATTTTTAPVTSYEGWNGQVWTQITSQTRAEEATSKPSSLEVKVGAVKDGRFSATLQINSKQTVSNISVTMNYDSTKVALSTTDQNAEAGGNVVENFVDGQYIYNYTNAEGTDFDGTFVTMNFIVVDPSMTSGVIYLKVNSFDDKAMKSIDCSVKDGIVSVSDAEIAAASANLKTVEVVMGDKAYELKDLGFEGITDCAVKDENILRYSDGRFATVALGSTQVALTYEDGSIQNIIVKVVDKATESSVADKETNTSSTVETSTTESKEETNNFSSSGVRTAIIVAVLLCVALVGAEYLLIFKPFSRIEQKSDDDNDEQEEDDEEEENHQQEKYEESESSDSDDDDDSSEE